MTTSYNNSPRSLPLHLAVISLFAFLLVWLPGAKAQTAVRVTPPHANSLLLRGNGKIAFTSDRDGNSEIYVMNSDGTGHIRITNNAGVDDYPVWSPDGRRIAFVSQTASAAYAIKLMNADGTHQTVLTPISSYNNPYPWHGKWSHNWSPDGAKIAFSDGGEIFTINVDGSHRVKLSKDPGGDSEPSWSPDGSRIVFSSYRVPWVVIHTMNADGSDLRALPSAGEYWDMSPDWSPTGDKIVFVVHAEWALPILYTANTDGTNRQPFDGTGSGSYHRNKPRWSPDGTRILFHIWEYFSNDSEVYVKNLDCGGFSQLTNTNGRNFNASWQPLGPVGCANPIDCSDFFVRQHYLDFLGRQPDATGFDAWHTVLNDCFPGDASCDRIHVSGAFFQSPEFQERGYFAYRQYSVAFGRKPDFAEFMPDLQRVSGFLSDQQLEAAKVAMIEEFIARPAFVQNYNGLGNTAYVDTLLSTAEVTFANKELLIDALNAGTKTRAQVLREIMESVEVYQKHYNQAFVVMQYFGYLRRDPDALYLNWIQELNTTGNSRTMINGFVNSPEYRARFGP